MPYKVGDSVVYLDPARVYTVKTVNENGTYTIEQQTAPTPLTVKNVRDELLRPNSYAVETTVEYLDPGQVYTVIVVNSPDMYTIQSPAGPPIGPVPDGLIRPH